MLPTRPLRSALLPLIPLLAVACSGDDHPNRDAGIGSADSGVGTGSGTAAPTDGPGAACMSPGSTKACCTTGTLTCEGEGEFAKWSNCVDARGKTLTCPYVPTGGCAPGEFGIQCDGGSPVQPPDTRTCKVGEFAPECDAGWPGSPPGLPSLCTDQRINNEPEILAGYAPADGQKVGADGQIKVWITDEQPAFIAPGEEVDLATGAIVTPGDRSAKASDGYLYEPALYIAPATAESGGRPYFPTAVKGVFNNSPQTWTRRSPNNVLIQGAPIDPAPAGVQLNEEFNTEFVWDVSSLGLAPGTYVAEFAIHDGDRDRGVGCITIEITPLR
jgi:hypothetical protein